MTPSWPSIDWDLLSKALGAAVAGLFAVVKLRTAIPPSRSRLKADLQLLKLLDRDDPDYALVKAYIGAELKRLYSRSPRQVSSKVPHVFRWHYLVIGTLPTVALSAGTLSLINHRSFWWATVTGVLALFFLVFIAMAFDPESAKANETDQPPAVGTPN